MSLFRNLLKIKIAEKDIVLKSVYIKNALPENSE
jgi:hypothetical protein